MAFTIKSWHNKGEGTSTPINAAALKDIESRLSTYTETFANALSITTSMLASGAVTAAKIGSEAVEEAKIKAEAVGTGKLANLAVTTAKIAESAVTTAKIAEGAITGTKLAAATVTDAKLEKPVIVGAVSAEGVKTSGEGFSSEKTTVGKYKITLTGELATQGTMTVTILGGVGVLIPIATPGKKEFTVEIYSTASALTNAPFNFQIKAA